MSGPILGQFTQFSITTVATQFLILLGSLGAAVLTARVLGPEGKGTLTLLLLIPAFTVTFGRMGIGHAVNYFSNKESRTKIIVNSLIVTSLLIILFLIITPFVTYCFKDSVFKGINFVTLICISFTVPIFFYSNLFTFLVQSLYKFNLRNTLLLVEALTKIALLVLLLVIFKFGITGALLASISPAILLVALLARSLLKEINVKEIKIDYQFIKHLLIFGSKSHVGNVLKDLSYRGDILIVSYYLSPAFVGYYIISVTMAEIIWKIPDAIGNVLLARVAMMNKDEAASFTPTVCRRLLPVVLCVCVVTILLSNPIITFFFGNDYRPSATAFALLVPGVLVFTIWKILANDLIAQGFPAQYSMTSGISLIIMLGLDIILIPTWGINGASIASTVSYTTATVFIILIYRKITKVSLKNLIILSGPDCLFYKDLVSRFLTSIRQPIINRT